MLQEQMSQEQTRKIINWVWSGIVVFLLIYSFNTLAVVQWAERKLIISFPLVIFGNDGLSRDTILYIGIPVILILLLILLYLSTAYFYNSTEVGIKWNQRVPIFLDLEIGMKDNKVAENKFVKNWNRLSIISLILPYLVSLQQLYKFIDESNQAFHLESGKMVSIFSPTSPLVLFGDKYRYGGENGWTFFLFYVPIMFIILEIIVFFYLYKYFKKVFGLNQFR